MYFLPYPTEGVSKWLCGCLAAGCGNPVQYFVQIFKDVMEVVIFGSVVTVLTEVISGGEDSCALCSLR